MLLPLFVVGAGLQRFHDWIGFNPRIQVVGQGNTVPKPLRPDQRVQPSSLEPSLHGPTEEEAIEEIERESVNDIIVLELDSHRNVDEDFQNLELPPPTLAPPPNQAFEQQAPSVDVLEVLHEDAIVTKEASVEVVAGFVDEHSDRPDVIVQEPELSPTSPALEQLALNGDGLKIEAVLDLEGDAGLGDVELEDDKTSDILRMITTDGRGDRGLNSPATESLLSSPVCSTSQSSSQETGTEEFVLLFDPAVVAESLATDETNSTNANSCVCCSEFIDPECPFAAPELTTCCPHGEVTDRRLRDWLVATIADLEDAERDVLPSLEDEGSSLHVTEIKGENESTLHDEDWSFLEVDSEANLDRLRKLELQVELMYLDTPKTKYVYADGSWTWKDLYRILYGSWENPDTKSQDSLRLERLAGDGRKCVFNGMRIRSSSVISLDSWEITVDNSAHLMAISPHNQMTTAKPPNRMAFDPSVWCKPQDK